MRGRFITLEGGEGAGKSTLLHGLVRHLAARGVEPMITREPGGTPLGEVVRAILLDPAHRGMAGETELLLMFAARAEHVRQVIAPALEQGRTVLSDRFVDASHAYQGGGRGQPVERIHALQEWTTAGCDPDLTFLLDLAVATGRERVAGRGAADRIETESDGFFERVRARYRERAAAEPARFCVLDAAQAPDAVLAAACARLDQLLDGGAQ